MSNPAIELTDADYLDALPGTVTQTAAKICRSLSTVRSRLERMEERHMVHVSHFDASPVRCLRVPVYAAGIEGGYLHTDGSVVIPPRHELMSALFGEWA